MTMRMVRNIVGIFILLAVILASAQAASAEAFVAHGGNIIVHSKVAETHYVLIDASNTITQITSNTTGNARPRVFFQKVAPGNERPMSDEVYHQYRTILPTGKTSTVGVVYKQSELARLPLFSTSPKTGTDLLAFITQ